MDRIAAESSKASERTRARPRVVIVGAGFGGYTLARALKGRPVDVLIVDRNNYHLFTPLLYQVASSLLNPSDIAFPIRKGLARSRNIRVLLAEVTGLDLAGKAVLIAEGGRISYDRLVLATGSATSFFGMESVERAALGLKDLPEALQLRNHVLTCFETASRTRDPAARARLLTFVVVGGGPTGVEYVGALSELVRLNLVRDFPELDLGEVRIVLVELADRVLGMFSEPLSEYAGEELRRKGVELRLGTRVVDAGKGRIELADGERIEAETLIWAAGVKPADLAEPVPAPRSRSGRIVVDEFLRVAGRDNIYAIGDVASFEQDGAEIPMLAPPAMQQARALAANLLRASAGKPLRPFCYRDKGVMATIGRNAAVTETKRLRLTGLPGWIGWLALHLFYIISVRSRVLILFQWAWEYFRYDRPIRIIARARGDDPDPACKDPTWTSPPRSTDREPSAGVVLNVVSGALERRRGRSSGRAGPPDGKTPGRCCPQGVAPLPDLSEPDASLVTMKRKKTGRKQRRDAGPCPVPSCRRGSDPARSPFGCTGELAEHLRSIPFTREQERRIARAVKLAKQLARQNGERIDANEAMLRIHRDFLAHHRG